MLFDGPLCNRVTLYVAFPIWEPRKVVEHGCFLPGSLWKTHPNLGLSRPQKTMRWPTFAIYVLDRFSALLGKDSTFTSLLCLSVYQINSNYCNCFFRQFFGLGKWYILYQFNTVTIQPIANYLLEHKSSTSELPSVKRILQSKTTKVISSPFLVPFRSSPHFTSRHFAPQSVARVSDGCCGGSGTGLGAMFVRCARAPGGRDGSPGILAKVKTPGRQGNNPKILIANSRHYREKIEKTQAAWKHAAELLESGVDDREKALQKNNIPTTPKQSKNKTIHPQSTPFAVEIPLLWGWRFDLGRTASPLCRPLAWRASARRARRAGRGGADGEATAGALGRICQEWERSERGAWEENWCGRNGGVLLIFF